MSRDSDPGAGASAPPPPRQVDNGWHPANDDDSPRAVAWRARTALRRADRALSNQESLRDSIARLQRTIETAEARAEKLWTNVVKLAWGVGLPVLVAVVLAVIGGLKKLLLMP